MTRIILDQGLPAKTAVLLRAGGWDAVHTREIGLRTATDAEILERAAMESRTVVTLDRDFPQILALTAANRPSVVLIRQQRLRAADLSALVESIWRAHGEAIDKGCVLKAGSRGVRVRLLPLR